MNIMISIRETVLPADHKVDDDKTKRAVNLASGLAGKLKDGEYLINRSSIPTIFVRLDQWTAELVPETLDLNEIGLLRLNDASEVPIRSEDIEKYLANEDKCRLVLLSERGFSSFVLDRHSEE